MSTVMESPVTRAENQNREETVSPQQQPSTEERIRIRAYELYQQRGDSSGDAESDWYQAETEIVTQLPGSDH